MSSTDLHIIIIIYCHGNEVWKPPNLSATPLTKTWCILLKSKNVRIVNKTLTTFILYTSLPVQSSVCGWRRSPQRKKSQHFAYESCFGFSALMFVLLQQPKVCCEINMTKLQLYHKLEAQDVLPMCVCVCLCRCARVWRIGVLSTALLQSALAEACCLCANQISLIQGQTETRANQSPNSFPERK